MGKVFQNFRPGERKRLDLRCVLYGGRTGNPLLRIRDLGDDTQNRADPKRPPPQGGPPIGGDTTSTQYGGAIGVPTFGGSDDVSKIRGGWDVRPPHCK